MTAQADVALIEPAYRYAPPRARSLVGPASTLAEALGRPLDDEQRLAVDTLTGVRTDGRPASLEACVICPRQNMKTWIMQLIVLVRLLEPDGDQLIVWSAHLFDTAQETFRDFDELIESCAPLRRRVTRVYRGNGEEQIHFVGGRRLRFRARAKTGGRGLSGDCVVLDEGFALAPPHMGALLPILSTRRRALVLYGSSSGQVDSAILRGVRDRGRAGGRGAPAYVEWCVPGSLAEPGCVDHRCHHAPGAVGCTLDREDLWVRANPAIRSGRILVEYVRSERLALPPEEFARERLGWWDDPESGQETIPLAAWLARVDPESKAAEGARPVFAVDVAPDRRSAAIAVAAWRAGGGRHLGLVEHRPGSLDWLLPRLVGLVAGHEPSAVVLDGASPAAALLPQLAEYGLTVRNPSDPAGALVVTGAAEMGKACGGLVDAVTAEESDIWHRGDPLVEKAWRAAQRRDIGDGGWGLDRRRTDGDITAAVAITLAHYGHVVHGGADYDLLASIY